MLYSDWYNNTQLNFKEWNVVKNDMYHNFTSLKNASLKEGKSSFENMKLSIRENKIKLTGKVYISPPKDSKDSKEEAQQEVLVPFWLSLPLGEKIVKDQYLEVVAPTQALRINKWILIPIFQKYIDTNLQHVVPLGLGWKPQVPEVKFGCVDDLSEINVDEEQFLQYFLQPHNKDVRLMAHVYKSSEWALGYMGMNSFADSHYYLTKRIDAFGELEKDKYKEMFQNFFAWCDPEWNGFGAGDGAFEIFMVSRIRYKYLEEKGVKIGLHDSSIQSMKFLLHSFSRYSRHQKNIRGEVTEKYPSNITQVQTHKENFNREQVHQTPEKAPISIINSYNNFFTQEERDVFIQEIVDNVGNRPVVFSIHTANNAKELEKEKQLYKNPEMHKITTFYYNNLIDTTGQLYLNKGVARNMFLKNTTLTTQIDDFDGVPWIGIYLKVNPWVKMQFLVKGKIITIDENNPFPPIGRSLRFKDSELKSITKKLKENGFNADIVKIPGGNTSYFFVKKKK